MNENMRPDPSLAAPHRTLGELGALIVGTQRELMQCLGTSKAEMLQKNIRLWQVEVEAMAAERVE